MSTRKTGASATTQTAPWKARKIQAAKRREEQRWSARSSAVETRFVCPLCSGPHAKQDCADSDASPADANQAIDGTQDSASTPARPAGPTVGQAEPHGRTR